MLLFMVYMHKASLDLQLIKLKNIHYSVGCE